MRDLISFAGAVADETRWRLVQLLYDEAMCGCELAEILGMPQSSVSSHLQVVRKAGLLDSERRGKWIYYRVRPKLRRVLAAMAGQFGADAARNAILRADAKRAAKRLEQRATSCCPLPRRLAPATAGASIRRGHRRPTRVESTAGAEGGFGR